MNSLNLNIEQRFGVDFHVIFSFKPLGKPDFVLIFNIHPPLSELCIIGIFAQTLNQLKLFEPVFTA
jgi:hypothetical protein